jgi:chorismate mutase
VTDSPRGAEALVELARCRDEIEQIDRQIIALLSRRLTLGKRTGELKRLAGLPILDPTREAAVIRRVTGEARDAGLPPEPIREVFWQIVGMSRRAQESGDADRDARDTGGAES